MPVDMMEYHRLFDDANTDIITALANDAPEEIKPIISNYNVNKLHKDFISEIKSGCTKEILIKTTEFLKVKPRSANINTICKTIVIGIQNFLHEKCEACNQFYTVKFLDTPQVP